MLRKGKNYNPENIVSDRQEKVVTLCFHKIFQGAKKKILQTSNFNYKCSLLKFDQLET